MKTLFLLLLAAAVPSLCRGQGAESAHWRNRCRLALQIVREGHPQPHEAWAYRQISTCGSEAGEILALHLRALRTSRDTSELKRLTDVPGYRDRRVYEASVEIVADRAASDVARAYAFRNLLWLVSEVADPALYDPWNPAGLGCNGSAMDRDIRVGEPLPGGYEGVIRTLAGRIAGDHSEPAPVRYGARCVLSFAGPAR